MNRLARLARPAEIFLGIVFLVAAVLKALDINLFAVQIYGYGLIAEDDKWILGPLAVFTVGVETFLGCAMLLGFRLYLIILTAAQAMLVILTCFIFYGWLFHDLKDCGCFGGFFTMGPISTIAKNIVLLLIGGIAWLGFMQRGIGDGSAGSGAVKLLASLVVTAGIVGYSYGTLEVIEEPPASPPSPTTTTPEAVDQPEEVTDEGPAPPAAEAPGKFAQYVVEGDTQTYRLAEGEYLVAMLSMTCEHCMESVPILNSYVYMPDLPPLVSLGFEEMEGKLEEFRAITSPEFPIHNLGDQTLHFFSLIGKEPPRLSYVVDGHQVHHWDMDMPAPEEILEVVEQHRAGGEMSPETAEPALTE